MAVIQALFFAGLAAALPQGGSIPPSPTGADCSFHVDHWDCATPCATRTSTQLQVAATITNLPEFMDSMNARYSTSGVSFSGTRVVVHTSLYSFPGGSFTGYGVYDSNALRSAGYSIVTSLSVFTTCPTATPTLPPSPTGSLCSPHGDHFKSF
ncbi:uncharacterized protein CTRU02_207366 [Colletotrichum truncatum]|uniref:Uncharacterized protein n=1 Tax=Colletotrichum truncatum TaxID=5467 RepID=A0ACC3Z0V2_COLTU|nr:uncharacterized protein CTRU02_00999 [Colletotrichum truncatum]KAF6800594.1 hypothetical protein CTRU02_00999 [Colletotrichum truncatum]